MITRLPYSQPINPTQERATTNRISPITRPLNHQTTGTTSHFVNTIPKISAGVNTTPAQNSNQIHNPLNEEMIQGIVNTFNRSRTTHPYMQSAHQDAPLNPAGSTNQGTDNSLNPQEGTEQNLLSSTVTIQDNKKTSSDGDSEKDDSDDPDMDGVFRNEKGERDYKAYAVHWRAKYKAKGKAAASAKTTHKINYGRVHPPTLHLEQELRSCTYELWKNQWKDFYEKFQTFESEGLAFLKEQSVPDPHLKGLISLCDSVDSVFTLLDT